MHKRNTSKGFTIVELVVVIVVIAILATISMLAFNGVQARAKISGKGANINNLLHQLETKSLLSDSGILLSAQYATHSQDLDALQLGSLGTLIVVGNDLPIGSESCRVDPQTGDQTSMDKDHFCVEVLGVEDVRIIWWNDIEKRWIYQEYNHTAPGYSSNEGSGEFPGQP